MLNSLTLARAVEELGYKQIEGVYELFRRIFGRMPRPNEDILFRIAPSIICRSECELLAVSAPRFAVRACFPDGSFANLRRLPFLAQSVPNWDSRRHNGSNSLPNVELLVDEAAPHVRTVIDQNLNARGRCIADSFLRPGNTLSKEHYFLESSVGRLYGEHSNPAIARGLVPFIRHMRLGGGMCAQAACFMAACLMDGFINAIHGIPEITALARIPSDKALELDLGGLTRESICLYFSNPKVGLTCQEQRSPCVMPFMPHALRSPDASKVVADIHETFRNRLFQVALRAYVISGFPAIIPVDLGLMHGNESSLAPFLTSEPIYSCNNVQIRLAGPKQSTHAVVAVACSKTNKSQFVINDPATFPFLLANTHQLVQSRTYTVSNHPQAEGVDQGSPAILPVLPKSVNVPLLELPANKVHSADIGLLIRLKSEYHLAFQPSEVQEVLKSNSQEIDDPGEFALLSIGSRSIDASLGLSWTTVLERLLGNEASEPIELLHALIDSKVKIGQWTWAQYRHALHHARYVQALILWDAAQYTTGNTPIVKCALARDSAGHWEILYYPEPPSVTDSVTDFDPKNIGSPPNPEEACQEGGDAICKPAAISSFVMDAPFESLRNWPNDNVAIEWYMLSQSHFSTSRWKKSMPQPNPLPSTAVEWLAAIADDPAAVHIVANEIATPLTSASPHVLGVASFVPTISFPPKSPGGKVAQQALIGLCKLVSAVNEILQSKQRSAIKYIEIVAGTRATGLWPGKKFHERKNTKEQIFVANLLSEDDVIENLVSNLEIISCNVPDSQIIWSLEMEPGPLFAMNSWEAIDRLIDRLDASDLLRTSVGINLDIAHWRMAFVNNRSSTDHKVVHRIENSKIFSRISHGHISGHSLLGHFGDLDLRTLNSPGDYLPWINLLNKRVRTKSPVPFSGYLSLELESIKDFTALKTSVADLEWLLKSNSSLVAWPKLTPETELSNMRT
jgi:hypothetical protein